MRNMEEMPEVTQLRKMLRRQTEVNDSLQGMWVQGFMAGLCTGIVLTALGIAIALMW